MELKKGHIYFGAACLIAGIVLGAGFRSCAGSPKQPCVEPTIIHDTVCIKDTVRIVGKTKVVKTVETDIQIVRDTDTVYVTMPLETKEYRDTFTTDTSRIELGVRYTGYRAKIDNVDLNYRFETKPVVVEKKRGFGQFIGVGIGVGYGASVVGQTVYAAPEVGIHVTYGWGYLW